MIMVGTWPHRGLRVEGRHDPMRGINARQKDAPEEARARLQSTLITKPEKWIAPELVPVTTSSI